MESIFHKLQVFLSLCLGRATFPKSVQGKISSNPIPISIYYAPNSRIKMPTRELYSFQMLLALQDIGEKFEGCLINWFEKAEKLEPVYNLYAATLLNEEMYVEHRFLSLVQTLEAYHSRMYDEKSDGHDEYSRIYEVLITAIPTDTDERLKQRITDSLEFASLPSLRGRLGDIWKTHKVLVKQIITNREKYDGFCNDVVITRNYLTHYNTEIKSKAKTDHKSLIYMSNRLRFLIEICLLSELGFSDTEIANIISRHTRYKSY